MAPTETPTPMPALAPLERPLEAAAVGEGLLVEDEEEEVVGELVGVGVEVMVSVLWAARTTPYAFTPSVVSAMTFVVVKPIAVVVVTTTVPELATFEVHNCPANHGFVPV